MKLPVPQADWPPSWVESHHYDRLEFGADASRPGYSSAFALRRAHILELITRVAPPGARILDVAAAQGNFSLALAELGHDVVWNDLRHDLAPYVRLKHERGRVTYAPGDVFALGFGAEFDVVLAGEVIEHVADPGEFLRTCGRLLAPGGLMIVATLNRTLRALALAKIGAEYVLRWLPAGTHDWRKFLTPDELRGFLATEPLDMQGPFGVSFDPLSGAWRLSADSGVNYMMTVTRRAD